MIPEAELILNIAKEIIYGEKGRTAEFIRHKDINWHLSKRFITYHEFHPFVYPILKDFPLLPPDLIEFLRNNYYLSIIRSQALRQEFLRIADAFREKGIDILPIKGIAFLGDIYREHPLRPMTDIDVLVKEGYLLEAENIFIDLGYRKESYRLKEDYWRKSQCHVTFYNRKDIKMPFVEMHWDLDFKRKNRNILSELWNRVREVNLDGRMIKLLSPEDSLFSLALHQRRFGKVLCLKNVFDLALILNKYKDFDWDYVCEESRAGRMTATVFFILTEAQLLLDMPLDILQKFNVPKWKKRLIHRFIEDNMFSFIKRDNKRLYLKSHFLLYDSLWEPVDYILNIPKEQFARYYNLDTYGGKTDFLYKNRIFYIVFRSILSLIPRKG